MTRKALVGVAVLCSLLVLVCPAQSVDETADVPFVVVCPISGEINDGVAVVVERAVKESVGAAAIIFVVDTPGGRVDAAIEITKHI